MDKPVYKPSQILRLVASGQIVDPQPKGTATIRCQPKGHVVPGDTESPTFWMNGSYIYCGHCGEQVLARVEFAEFVIDLTGERKRYPDRMQPQA